MIAKPTLEEVILIYDRIFPIESFTSISQNEKGLLEQSNPINEQTTDESCEISEKSFQNFQGFQDFSYNSSDFHCSDKEQEEEYIEATRNKSNSSISPEGKKKNKDRKIRTTITQEKLADMNRMFKEHQDDKDKGRNPTMNLKEIGCKLGLGYSTILHKFRQFRQNKVVKGGALLESLQKKRKYGKSKLVEKLIEKSLRQRPFYTAVELSKHIHKRFGRYYSRSIISRHLTEMGYSFNNIKPFPLQKNSGKYIEARRLFARIIDSYANDESNFIFADEVAFSVNLFSRYCTNFVTSVEQKKAALKEQDYISLLVIASNQKIHFHQIKHGFFNRQNFKEAIRKTGSLLTHNKRYSIEASKEFILLTDTHRIHYDEQNNVINVQDSLSEVFKQAKMRRFFLPPGSPQLNPLESLFSTIREKLAKEGIHSLQTLREKLEGLMKTIAKQPTHVYFKELKLWMEKAKNGQNY